MYIQYQIEIFDGIWNWVAFLILFLLHKYIYIYIYIYLYNLIEIIQNLQICYLKFHAMNYDFQAILKLSHNSNTLVLDKV